MEEGDRQEFISRIGTFFLLVGIGLMIIFIGYDLQPGSGIISAATPGLPTPQPTTPGSITVEETKDVNPFLFFFSSVVLLVFGWYFKRITAPPSKPGSRFEGLRKWMQKQREAQAQKQAAKKKK